MSQRWFSFTFYLPSNVKSDSRSPWDCNLITPNNVCTCPCIFGFGQGFQNGGKQMNGPCPPFLLYWLLQRKKKGHEASYTSWRSRGMIRICFTLRNACKISEKLKDCSQLKLNAIAYLMRKSVNFNSIPIDFGTIPSNFQLQLGKPLRRDWLQLSFNSVGVGPKSAPITAADVLVVIRKPR